MNLIYRSPIDYRSKVITNCGDGGDAFVPLTTLRECILRNENLPYDIALSIYHNGKALSSENRLPHLDGVEDIFLQVSLPLVGGKGGFGSMLRAIGAQIEKTTNREACRDLSGRRLRDVNEEKRIKDYIKRQATRKAEEEKKRKEKLKRLAEATVPATCQFDDREFEQTRAEIPDIVEDSIIVGLKQQQQQSKDQLARTSGGKRKVDQMEEDEEASKPDNGANDTANVNEPKAETSSNNKRINSSPPEGKMLNKQALWLGVDLDSDSESSSDDDEQVANSNVK